MLGTYVKHKQIYASEVCGHVDVYVYYMFGFICEQKFCDAYSAQLTVQCTCFYFTNDPLPQILLL